ncbi:MAG: FAD-dependent oxidoreductase [Actinomycetota bacterium]|nr:FAD-dependent oxidoreductase [Actinomycetota bacterium]
MPERFEAVVVGAGPAGSSAALALARAGRSVCLLERGPFPGAKNMFGGVIYGRILDHLVPEWWEQAPIQRWVTRRSTMILTDDQAVSFDVRSAAWGRPPYNGATAFRPDFDRWLAGLAADAGATLVCSTTATGLLRDAAGRVRGVRTDRPDGELESDIVIAADGVNSFLAVEAGLYPHKTADHFTLGAKEVLALPREELEARFNLTGREGADIEILGGTHGIPGGGFLYTNLDSVAVGVVLALPGLASAQRRPEEIIASLKRHPAIAPLVAGGTLEEYSAHLIPEGGYDAIPTLVGDGILVAGDAAALTLAAGIYLEGVNFAIGSGAIAGEAAADAMAAGDTSTASLSRYRRRLEQSFVLKDHKKLRRAPSLVLGERTQTVYPKLACALAEQLFTVENPAPKRGAVTIGRAELRRAGVRARDVARDAYAALRSFS